MPSKINPEMIKSAFEKLYFAVKEMESCLERSGYEREVENLREEMEEVREAFDDLETYYFRFMGKLSHNPEGSNANAA